MPQFLMKKNKITKVMISQCCCYVSSFMQCREDKYEFFYLTVAYAVMNSFALLNFISVSMKEMFLLIDGSI